MTNHKSPSPRSVARDIVAAVTFVVFICVGLLAGAALLIGTCWHDCSQRDQKFQLLLALGFAVAMGLVGLVGAKTARAGWQPYFIFLAVTLTATVVLVLASNHFRWG